MTRGLRVAVPLLRRILRTPGRIGLGLAVGVALAATALAANVGGAGRSAVAAILVEPVLVVAVPLTSLVFAVAALGDLRDDGTLVYVWLRPVPRWALAAAAVAASLQLAVPLGLATAAGVALLGGRPDLLAPGLVAVGLATPAYVGPFVALGLRTSRSLLWGLGYVVLVEGFLSRFVDLLATVSVRRYARSVFAGLAGVGGGANDVPLPVAAAALLAFAAVGLGLTVRWLTTREVP